MSLFIERERNGQIVIPLRNSSEGRKQGTRLNLPEGIKDKKIYVHATLSLILWEKRDRVDRTFLIVPVDLRFALIHPALYSRKLTRINCNNFLSCPLASG